MKVVFPNPVRTDHKVSKGDVVITDCGEAFLVAATGFDEYQLISLEQGNRMSDEKVPIRELLHHVREVGVYEVDRVLKSDEYEIRIVPKGASTN